MKKTPEFLSLADVLDIHSNQIENYGGSPGVRDLNLVESAIASPYQSFGGNYLHADIFEMAAAYAFHITKNHPFLDGNKRTALASALVFLAVNGIRISDPDGALYQAMVSLSAGKMNKADFAGVLKGLAHSK